MSMVCGFFYAPVTHLSGALRPRFQGGFVNSPGPEGNHRANFLYNSGCRRRRSQESEQALRAEEFFDGGVEGFGEFFLKVVAIEQAFVFLIGNVRHLQQNRGDVRGFQYNEIRLAIGRVFYRIDRFDVCQNGLGKSETLLH